MAKETPKKRISKKETSDAVMAPVDNLRTHWLVGGALLIVFALVVGFILSRSQADQVSTSTDIVNTNPTVDSVFISNAQNGLADDYPVSITPIAGATRTLHINGVVGDANGEADITSVNMAFYRSSATSTFNCTADNNDCYKVSSCTLTANNAVSKKYDCLIDLQYYADATDAGGQFPADNWVTYVKVVDASAAVATNLATTREVNTTLSLNIPGTINYGPLSLGATTTPANNQEMTLTQKGNDVADVTVTGSDMTCSSIGVIPVGQQAWALTDVSYTDPGSTPLASSSAADTNIGVNYQNDDATSSTKVLYWNLLVPATGVRGTCSGTTTISVIAS
ncbi:MAG: hypothetical protein NT091_01380 [Candidatus Falkowbacteria bacterium]|nr:hypothetical protein [Candidatus Falkowbacteria bacterium]